MVIDMGMCLRVPEDIEGVRTLIRAQGQCGKLTYMAPEVYADQDFSGFAVDVWACGIILFILLCGTSH